MDTTIIRRLSFTKYLLSEGVRKSYLPEPLYASALLSFHDAIELYLEVALEHLDIQSKQTSFMQYWDIISEKTKDKEKLPYKNGMKRLNKARVSLKHHGTLPSQLDIESFRSLVLNFFEETTPLLFNIAHDELSLMSFVKPDKALHELRKALECKSLGKLNDASVSLSLAFTHIKHYLIDETGSNHPESLYNYSSTIDRLELSRVSNNDYDNLDDCISIIKKKLEQLEKAEWCSSLGIDYSRYLQFNKNMPTVRRLANGQDIVTLFKELTDENELDTAFDFVVETSMLVNKTIASIKNSRKSKI